MTHLIQVVGVGCPACRQLEADVVAVVRATHLAATIERVDDPADMLALGILTLPSLLIDGRLVSTGCRGRRHLERIINHALTASPDTTGGGTK